ncbi:hypothetical protein [Afipia felis]|uniref:Phage-related protein n=2 Tax=Afipia felis TaxID=1035 RepID=A0A380WAZ0_AFIFE|nr:hypothetical protein [Afipia felis]EKS29385.1 hypothetical protein HMPREF9697_01913 [Afipia felis ATCC 53690]SUU78093.1 Phage-related protein [Afipia felis]SUU86158.1 Phage-related protein [Afipia felis]
MAGGGRTITQRIALDGGAQVKTDLEAIGAAAMKAFEKLAGIGAANSALGKVGSSVNELSNRLRKLQDAGGNFGGAFGGFASQVSSLGASLGILSSVSIGGTVAAFTALINKVGEAQRQLQNTADSLGVTAERLQALQDAASQVGIGGDQIAQALSKQIAAMTSANQASVQYGKAVDELKRKQSAGLITPTQYTQALRDLDAKMQESTNTFKKFGVAVSDNGGKTMRDPIKVFFEMGDAFKGMSDNVAKASAAQQIWGTRNAQVIALASKGAKGIEDLSLAAERLAPSLDKGAVAAFQRVTLATGNLGKAAEATKNHMLAAFAPSISTIIEAFTNVIVNSRAAWVNFAKTLADQVKPIVEDVVAVIEGRDKDVKNSFILKARDAVVDFASAVQGAVVNVIVPAFQGFLGILQIVADGINAVFGTKLTGGQLTIVAVVGSLSGAFGLLGSTIGVVVSAIGVLVSIFGGAAVAAAAVGVAIGALIVSLSTNLGSVKDTATGVFAAIPELAKTALDGVVSAFKAGFTIVAGLFDGLLNTAKSVFNAIMAGVQAVANAISGVIGGNSGGGDNAPAFADGGAVRGPGTGTSDSIRAWLSNGEYVQPTSAVNRYGLAFMNAIRAGRIAVSRVRDLMSGVDFSGIGAVMPNRVSYATGGAVALAATGGGMQPVHLHVGGQEHPLQGSPDVVRNLVIAAQSKSARSSGRKPTWFGGGR